ncbi:MAG TPA: hypothetical protein VJV79_02805 [Polyangiaceae bacterium]|nr:hypothetical protein [Polyangiaceae bacterium]
MASNESGRPPSSSGPALAEVEALLLKVTQSFNKLRVRHWRESPATTPVEEALRSVAIAIAAASEVVNTDPGDEREGKEASRMLMVASMIIERLLLRQSTGQSLPTVVGSNKRMQQVVSAVHGIRTPGDAQMLALQTLNAAARADPNSWKDTADWLCNTLCLCGSATIDPEAATDLSEEAERCTAIEEVIGIWAQGDRAPKWKPTNALLRRFGLGAASANALDTVWKSRKKYR